MITTLLEVMAEKARPVGTLGACVSGTGVPGPMPGVLPAEAVPPQPLTNPARANATKTVAGAEADLIVVTSVALAGWIPLATLYDIIKEAAPEPRVRGSRVPASAARRLT